MNQPLDGQIQPWYGSWPPEPYRGGSMKLTTAKARKFISRWKILFTLIGIALIGLLFQLALHDHFKQTLVGWFFHLCDELSKALIVAALIGAIVDSTIKLNL